MTTDLTALWHTNKRWRSWMDANTKFVTPSDDLDTLRYARVEAVSEAKLEYLQLSLAEIYANKAADIEMRERLPGHARNNGREAGLFRELADAAMLLLTALPESFQAEDVGRRICEGDEDWREWTGIDNICRIVNKAVYEHPYTYWQAYARMALFHIAHYPGLDLTAELDLCWRRLAEKHGWAAWAEWAGCQTYQDRLTFHARLVMNPTVLPTPWLAEES